jgi:hypothetical protein
LCGFGDFARPGGDFPAGFVGAGVAVGDVLGDGDADGAGCGSADGDGWTGTAAAGGDVGGEAWPGPGGLLVRGAGPRCG